MCIIAVKPAGKKMWSDDLISTMFFNNPDGAGFMYPENGGVRIRKGFMELKALKKALSQIPDAQNKTVVLHCRIATAGGVKPGMTHPFPFSDKDTELNATDIRAIAGFAHNGVLSTSNRKDFSDSADFMKYVLYPLSGMINNWRKNKGFRSVIEFLSKGSRFAILLNNGTCIRTGDWTDDNGYFYSNSSYQSTYKRYSGKNWGWSSSYGAYHSVWDEYDDVYGDNYGYSYSAYNGKAYDPNKKSDTSKTSAQQNSVLLPSASSSMITEGDITMDEDVGEDYFDGTMAIPLDDSEYWLEDWDGNPFDAAGFWIDELGDIWQEYVTDDGEIRYTFFDGAVFSLTTGYQADYKAIRKRYDKQLEAEEAKTVYA